MHGAAHSLHKKMLRFCADIELNSDALCCGKMCGKATSKLEWMGTPLFSIMT